MVADEFSIGGLHGWYGILLGLLASSVFLLSAWQDLRRKSDVGSLSSALWFFLALLFAIGVILLGLVD